MELFGPLASELAPSPSSRSSDSTYCTSDSMSNGFVALDPVLFELPSSVGVDCLADSERAAKGPILFDASDSQRLGSLSSSMTEPAGVGEEGMSVGG